MRELRVENAEFRIWFNRRLDRGFHGDDNGRLITFDCQILRLRPRAF
jgi:hypothetical protein